MSCFRAVFRLTKRQDKRSASAKRNRNLASLCFSARDDQESVLGFPLIADWLSTRRETGFCGATDNSVKGVVVTFRFEVIS